MCISDFRDVILTTYIPVNGKNVTVMGTEFYGWRRRKYAFS